MILLTMVSLGSYINNELDRKGMIQAELSRKSGLDSGWISNLISGSKELGLVSLIGLSKGLGVSADAILRAAGYLPSVPARAEQNQQLLYMFDQLNENDRKTIFRMMDVLLETKLPSQ